MRKILLFTVFLSLFLVLFIFSADSAHAGAASTNQSAYRWRNDDGGEPAPPTGATWIANENTAITGVGLSTIIRIRIEAEETAAGNFNYSPLIQFSSDATSCTTGTWTTLDTTTTAWRITDSANFTDPTATTDQLTTSAKAFLAGEMKDTSNLASTINIKSKSSEHEWAIRGDGAANNTTYRFRSTNNGVTFTTYTNCAQLTTVAATPAVLSWATGASDFAIYAGATANDNAVLTWNNGTLICSTALNDTNSSSGTCGSINKNQKYRVQAVLKNTGGTAAVMSGAGEFVDHVNTKTFWAGTSPTIAASTDCGFNDTGADDTSTTCNVAFNGNDVRITNTGTSVQLAATTGSEGFMYLITTDSDVPLSNTGTYMNTSIDSVTQSSSRITIGLKRIPGLFVRGEVRIRGKVKFR